jgi:hypothetical protein
MSRSVLVVRIPARPHIALPENLLEEPRTDSAADQQRDTDDTHTDGRELFWLSAFGDSLPVIVA